MTRPPFIPHRHPHRPQLVPPVAVDPEGLTGPTRAVARGPLWRCSSRGLFVPADVDASAPGQRIVEATTRVGGRRGALTGWAALHWLGGSWFNGTTAYGLSRPVCLSGRNLRPSRGIVISAERVDPWVLTVHDGVVLTHAVAATTFEMRHATPAVEAAVTWEMAAYDDLVDRPATLDFLGTLHGRAGVPQAREVMAFIDENSWSPWETRMRWIWVVLAGLPRPLCNRPIFDRHGRHLVTPDLLDPVAGLVAEYDGEQHAHAARRRTDRDRAALYRELGLEMVVMMRGDAADPGRVAARIVAARARARFMAQSARPWTIEQPPRWVPTVTVGQRRALGRGHRDAFLRYRRSA